MASVTYRIKGQYDGKAVKQAQSSFTALGNQIKSINNLVSGFAALKVIQLLKGVASEGMESFVAQNEALTRFNTAVSKTNLNLEKLNQIQTKISRNNLFDGDAINNAMTMATEMGLNEKQMEKVMEAATDMAASGIMPLDQAVKALSLSYNGNVTQLKKINPELENLSKTELANGKAVDLLAAKYDGFADSLSSTFSGRNTQWSNSISDLKSAIGSIPESLKFLSEGKLLEPLNKVTDWIVNNRNYIINFFLNLPEIAKTVFINIKQIISKTFENLPEIISEIGPLLINMAKSSFSTYFEIAKAAIEGIGTLLDFAIGNPFRSSKDFISTLMNNLIEGINEIPQHFPNWVKTLLGIDATTEPIKFRFSTSSSNSNKTWSDTAKGVETAINKAANSWKNGLTKEQENWKKLLETTSSIYGDDIENLKEQLKEILGKDLPEELQNALDGLTFSGTENKTTSASTNNTNSEIKSGLDGILSQMGELGTIIKDIASGDWFALIFEVVTKILSALTEQSNALVVLFAILTNLIATVIDTLVPTIDALAMAILGLFEPLAEVIESALNIIVAAVTAIMPVVNLVVNILNSLLPSVSAILSIVVVVVELVGLLIECFNPIFIGINYIIKAISTVISVVANTIGNVVVAIYNGVIAIYNGIMDLFNKGNGKKEYKDWYNYSDTIKQIWGTTSMDTVNELIQAAASSSSSSSSTSGSASYTAAKDIYLNIYYEHSFVNGDAQEIAIAIRDEIRAAEKLGY